jgi:hypothetical protein
MQKTARTGLGGVCDAWECSVLTLESTSMGTTSEQGGSIRFHAPRTLCRSQFLHVIGLEHVLNHCRDRGAVFWLAGDEIAGIEDAGGWVLRAK